MTIIPTKFAPLLTTMLHVQMFWRGKMLLQELMCIYSLFTHAVQLHRDAIKMLWCEDRNGCCSISSLAEETLVSKFCLSSLNQSSLCPSLCPLKRIKPTTLSVCLSFRKQSMFLQTHLSVYKNMLTLFLIVWHFCAAHQQGSKRTEENVFIWCPQSQTCTHGLTVMCERTSKFNLWSTDIQI